MVKRLSQKSTWIGVASILYAAFRALVLNDYSEVVPAVTTGVGLITVDG